jgi:putative NIF3 family GTP cyclohydrolase 1 type 2
VEVKNSRGIALGNFVLCAFNDELGCEEVAKLLSEKLETKIIYQAPNEKHRIKKLGILTGSAMSLLEDVVKMADIDAFVCGEGKHTYMHHADELGICVFYAGHYVTEKFGLIKLKTEIENNFKNLNTVFIDNPPVLRRFKVWS